MIIEMNNIVKFGSSLINSAGWLQVNRTTISQIKANRGEAVKEEQIDCGLGAQTLLVEEADAGRGMTVHKTTQVVYHVLVCLHVPYTQFAFRLNSFKARTWKFCVQNQNTHSVWCVMQKRFISSFPFQGMVHVLFCNLLMYIEGKSNSDHSDAWYNVSVVSQWSCSPALHSKDGTG